ncbi:MAG: hypothetical protein PUP90_04035 [Nostoc sp. S4]|nr:hypothetical protein [Nostoc sp. S4]
MPRRILIKVNLILIQYCTRKETAKVVNTQGDNHISRYRRLVALKTSVKTDALASLPKSSDIENKENNSLPKKTANIFGEAQQEPVRCGGSLRCLLLAFL